MIKMEFTKIHWWYETEVNGLKISIQKKSVTSKEWEASSSKTNRLAYGKTRKEAVLNYIAENIGRI